MTPLEEAVGRLKGKVERSGFWQPSVEVLVRDLRTVLSALEERGEALSSKPSREEVARVIDPQLELGGQTARDALAKADAILALFSPLSQEEG